MTAQEFWSKLTDREKLEFMRMRHQYPEFLDLSRNQFIEQFLEIWTETGRGAVTKAHQQINSTTKSL